MIRRLWQRIHEPRVVRVFWAGAYLCFLLGGISALIHPPNALEGALGLTFARVLCGFLILAGIVGIPSTLTGYWGGEKIALKSLSLGVVLYVGVIGYQQYQATTGNRGLQLGIVAGLAMILVARGWAIRKFDFEPRR